MTDSERLDWIANMEIGYVLKNRYGFHVYGGNNFEDKVFTGKDLRSAIDAAMREEG